MRVAVDAQSIAWSGRGGIGRVVRNLLPALRAVDRDDEFIAFATKADDGVVGLGGSALDFMLRRFPSAVRAGDFDAVLAPSTDVWTRARPVVLVLYDLYPLRYHTFLPSRYRWHFTRWKLQGAAWSRLRRASDLGGILAVSEATARDLQDLAHGPLPPVRVAGPGVDPAVVGWERNAAQDYVACQYAVEPPYLLYAGALNYQKNVHTVIEAYGRVRRQGQTGLRLVVAGSPSWPPYSLALQAPGVSHVSGPNDYDLGALYAGCEAFLYLSLYEGFGLPVVEAMANAAPVIVSRGSSLAEIAGDAGLLVNPLDVAGAANAIDSVVTDPAYRQELAERSARRAEDFSWDRMAFTVNSLLHQVA